MFIYLDIIIIIILFSIANIANDKAMTFIQVLQERRWKT